MHSSLIQRRWHEHLYVLTSPHFYSNIIYFIFNIIALKLPCVFAVELFLYSYTPVITQLCMQHLFILISDCFLTDSLLLIYLDIRRILIRVHLNLLIPGLA